MRIARLNSRIAALAVPLAIALLSSAATASADVGETIILRCTHHQSMAGFSQSAYRQALKELNADAEEYTDCAQLIRQAQLAAASGRSGAIASAIPATPAEQRAIAHAAHAGAGPVRVGNQVIHPGVVRANIASAISSLPTPLLAITAFLLACLIALAGGVLRNRIRARRTD